MKGLRHSHNPSPNQQKVLALLIWTDKQTISPPGEKPAGTKKFCLIIVSLEIDEMAPSGG